MSAKKVRAWGGLLVLTGLAVPAEAGSIRSTGRSARVDRGELAPTGLVTRPVDFENLALTGPNPAAVPTPVAAVSVPSGGATSPVALNFGRSSSLGGTSGGWSSFVAPVATTEPAHDAFLNFGPSGFAEAETLTTGAPRSFAQSPAFARFFGPSGPSAQDITRFEDQVVATVEHAYNQAGLPIDLTTDPNSPAAHMMSIVSGASYAANPGAIGITAVGHDGFSFIDKLTPAASVSDLATAVGNNVAHELMHAFGIADHPEQSGPYIDAATTSWTNLADSNTRFSTEAGSLLSGLDFRATGSSVQAGAQEIDGEQVLTPEPSAIALWGLIAAAGAVAARHRRARGRA